MNHGQKTRACSQGLTNSECSHHIFAFHHWCSNPRSVRVQEVPGEAGLRSLTLQLSNLSGAAMFGCLVFFFFSVFWGRALRAPHLWPAGGVWSASPHPNLAL